MGLGLYSEGLRVHSEGLGIDNYGLRRKKVEIGD